MSEQNNDLGLEQENVQDSVQDEEQDLIKVNYYIRSMERAISATFAYGPDSNDNPYFTMYFLVNNSGIVVVYDKSVPTGQPEEAGILPVEDELRSMMMRFKQGTEKKEVLEYINEELMRIGEKLQKEGRVLNDTDVDKLIAKIARRYEDKRQPIYK